MALLFPEHQSEIGGVVVTGQTVSSAAESLEDDLRESTTARFARVWHGDSCAAVRETSSTSALELAFVLSYAADLTL
jgi:hypothetical protein